MRTGFIAAFLLKTTLPFQLWAASIPETGSHPAKSITQLLERLSVNSSSSVSYHYACQVATGEYGLEIQIWDNRHYCQYLNRFSEHEVSEEFTPLYLDEEALQASVDGFLQENNRLSNNYWEFKENNLRYINNQGVRTEHVLLPRNVMPGSGSGISSGCGPGLSSADDPCRPGKTGEESKINVAAIAGGTFLTIMILITITGFIVEANKHCVLNKGETFNDKLRAVFE